MVRLGASGRKESSTMRVDIESYTKNYRLKKRVEAKTLIEPSKYVIEKTLQNYSQI